MTKRLVGKVAIVTGAASAGEGTGNGTAISTLFAREGASVILVGRTPERAKKLEDEIRHEGGTATTILADIAEQDQVEAMISSVVKQYGRLDILCNNVGIGGPGMVTNLEEDVWERAISVNLTGTMWCCRYAIPHMRTSGGGSIINISTIAAVRGFQRGTTGFTPYAATKAGIAGMSLAMAADYAQDGIRVNNLVVGSVMTPLLERQPDSVLEKIQRDIPLPYRGTAWDVGWAAVFLASDEARWITGTSITIDGGQTSLMRFPS